MGWFKEVFDDALGIVQTPKATVQPVITADDIVKSAVEQGVLGTSETAGMEPVPMATAETLWPQPAEPIPVEFTGQPAAQPVAFPWWALGLGLLWYWQKKR